MRAQRLQKAQTDIVTTLRTVVLHLDVNAVELGHRDDRQQVVEVLATGEHRAVHTHLFVFEKPMLVDVTAQQVRLYAAPQLAASRILSPPSLAVASRRTRTSAKLVRI